MGGGISNGISKLCAPGPQARKGTHAVSFYGDQLRVIRVGRQKSIGQILP